MTAKETALTHLVLAIKVEGLSAIHDRLDDLRASAPGVGAEELLSMINCALAAQQTGIVLRLGEGPSNGGRTWHIDAFENGRVIWHIGNRI